MVGNVSVLLELDENGGLGRHEELACAHHLWQSKPGENRRKVKFVNFFIIFTAGEPTPARPALGSWPRDPRARWACAWD